VVRIFQVPISASVLGLLFSETAILFSSFFFACYFVLGVDPTPYLLYELGLARISVAVFSMIWALYLVDMYTHIVEQSVPVLIQRLVMASGIVFMLEAMVSYAFPELRLRLSILGSGCGLAAVALVIWRLIYARRLFDVIGAQRFLFTGITPLTVELAEHISNHPELGIHVAGYLDDASDAKAASLGRQLGPLECLGDVTADLNPDRIIVAVDQETAKRLVYPLIDARLSGVPIQDAAAACESICGRVSVTALEPSKLVLSRVIAPRRGDYVRHRVLELAIAFCAAPLAIPLMLLIAALLKLTGGGPVLKREQRVGRDGVPFSRYRFRLPRETGSIIGRIGRALRVEGMAQLINVWKGEMSVFGPRPLRPELAGAFAKRVPFYHHRHAVRPGITGWMQIHDRFENAPEDMVRSLEYDLYYVKHASCSLDLLILLHAIKVIVAGRGRT
jgi:lipopolysaccharide/colanic/teichoic acid biosynthesis glycosyltransferase